VSAVYGYQPIVGFVIVVAVTVFLWRRAYGKERATTPAQRLATLRAQLVRMNMGRVEVAERLVAYERERRPELTETGAYRAAIGRMRR
jgi:hypothetical protein